MNQEMIDYLSKRVGVKLTVRDNNAIMDVSAEKHLEKMLKSDKTFSGRTEISYEEAIERMYKRGNKVD